MRRFSTGVLAVLAAGACVAAGSARVQRSPVFVLLNTNDRFTVAGSLVACRVFRRNARVTNRLLCFEQTKPLSFRPRPGSFELELAEGGVGVSRVGTRGGVFSRTELAPAGEPSGSALATALLGGTGKLTTRRDKAFVAGTNVVCRPFGDPPNRSLLCVLLGRDGHVQDGTFLAFISDHGVLIAQSRNGQAVTVFQRRHGR